MARIKNTVVRNKTDRDVDEFQSIVAAFAILAEISTKLTNLNERKTFAIIVAVVVAIVDEVIEKIVLSNVENNANDDQYDEKTRMKRSGIEAKNEIEAEEKIEKRNSNELSKSEMLKLRERFRGRKGMR